MRKSSRPMYRLMTPFHAGRFVQYYASAKMRTFPDNRATVYQCSGSRSRSMTCVYSTTTATAMLSVYAIRYSADSCGRLCCRRGNRAIGRQQDSGVLHCRQCVLEQSQRLCSGILAISRAGFGRTLKTHLLLSNSSSRRLALL